MVNCPSSIKEKKLKKLSWNNFYLKKLKFVSVLDISNYRLCVVQFTSKNLGFLHLLDRGDFCTLFMWQILAIEKPTWLIYLLSQPFQHCSGILEVCRMFVICGAFKRSFNFSWRTLVSLCPTIRQNKQQLFFLKSQNLNT